jgi:hypothetical protein
VLKLIGVLLLLIVAAILLATISFNLAEPATTGSIFISNLMLNIVAELIGVCLAVSGVIILTLLYARKKFEGVATPIAGLVAQLRAEGVISAEAARRSMVCAVKVITPESMSQRENNQYHLGLKHRPCDVCSLPTTVDEGIPCRFCKLEKHIWTIENKPILQ